MTSTLRRGTGVSCVLLCSSDYSNSVLFHMLFFSLSLLVLLPSPSLSSAVPQPPTGLTWSDVTASSVTLRWDQDTSWKEPIRSYTVVYQPRGHYSRVREETGITRPTYTVTNLKPFTTYIFQVMAVNSMGQSRPSRPVEVTTGELGQYIYLACVSLTHSRTHV